MKTTLRPIGMSPVAPTEPSPSPSEYRQPAPQNRCSVMPSLTLHRCGWILLGFSAVTAPSRGSDAIEAAGDALQYILPVTSAGLTWYHHDGAGAGQLAESLGATAAVTFALKYSVQATRPNGGQHSFPSAHTSISFSSAEFLRKRYGWEYGVPAYAAASLVAYSRVESNNHHPKDVVAGAAIGILSSYIFTKPYQGWTANLGYENHTYMLTVNRNW